MANVTKEGAETGPARRALAVYCSPTRRPVEDVAAQPFRAEVNEDVSSPAPAYTLTPRSTGRGTGVLVMRVYGATRGGVRYELPPDVEVKRGECIVPGCDCGGVGR